MRGPRQPTAHRPTAHRRHIDGTSTASTGSVDRRNVDPVQELAEEVWRERERAHVTRVEDLVAAHLHRRRSGRKHPVEDFLWVYYSYRPGQLRRWHPGPGVVLRGDQDPTGRRSWKHYAALGDGTIFDAESFRRDRGDTLVWVSELLSATAARQPTYSCFGLHEWAMIYRSREGERRHEQLPLRVSQAEADAVVAAAQIRCSHFVSPRPAAPLASRTRRHAAPRPGSDGPPLLEALRGHRRRNDLRRRELPARPRRHGRLDQRTVVGDSRAAADLFVFRSARMGDDLQIT